jgi:hypothetical protein
MNKSGSDSDMRKECKKRKRKWLIMVRRNGSEDEVVGDKCKQEWH